MRYAITLNPALYPPPHERMRYVAAEEKPQKGLIWYSAMRSKR